MHGTNAPDGGATVENKITELVSQLEGTRHD